LKQFKFKLEPVLNVRKTKEEEIQVQLASALDKLQEAVEEMGKTLEHRHSTASKLEEFKVHPVGVEDLIIYQNYLETLDGRLVNLEMRVREIETEVEEVRNLLLQACKDKKIIEKIKERQKNIYMSKSFRQECDFLDEIGVIRNARKKLALD
jgi:flagellar protein FliJ